MIGKPFDRTRRELAPLRLLSLIEPRQFPPKIMVKKIYKMKFRPVAVCSLLIAPVRLQPSSSRSIEKGISRSRSVIADVFAYYYVAFTPQWHSLASSSAE